MNEAALSRGTEQRRGLKNLVLLTAFTTAFSILSLLPVDANAQEKFCPPLTPPTRIGYPLDFPRVTGVSITSFPDGLIDFRQTEVDDTRRQSGVQLYLDNICDVGIGGTLNELPSPKALKKTRKGGILEIFRNWGAAESYMSLRVNGDSIDYSVIIAEKGTNRFYQEAKGQIAGVDPKKPSRWIVLWNDHHLTTAYGENIPQKTPNP